MMEMKGAVVAEDRSGELENGCRRGNLSQISVH